jgi:hypothetical protein
MSTPRACCIHLLMPCYAKPMQILHAVEFPGDKYSVQGELLYYAAICMTSLQLWHLSHSMLLFAHTMQVEGSLNMSVRSGRTV